MFVVVGANNPLEPVQTAGWTKVWSVYSNRVSSWYFHNKLLELPYQHGLEKCHARRPSWRQARPLLSLKPTTSPPDSNPANTQYYHRLPRPYPHHPSQLCTVSQQIFLPQCLAIFNLMGAAVHGIRIYHNKHTKVSNPTIPATIQMPIDLMVTAQTPIRMSIDPTATRPTSIRMPTNPSATTPTANQMPTTPSATAPAPMDTQALDKTLMEVHNHPAHRMGVLMGILSSTSRMRAHTRHPLDNTHSNMAAAIKISTVAMAAAVRMTCHRLVTTFRATMTISGRQ